GERCEIRPRILQPGDATGGRSSARRTCGRVHQSAGRCSQSTLVDIAQIEQTTAQGTDVANLNYGIAAQLILRVEVEVLKIGIPESRRYSRGAEGGCRSGKRVQSCDDLEGRGLRDGEDRTGSGVVRLDANRCSVA